MDLCELRHTSLVQALPFCLEDLRVVLPTPEMPKLSRWLCQLSDARDGRGGGRFYRRYDRAPSPSDPLHLFLFFKQIRALLS